MDFTCAEYVNYRQITKSDKSVLKCYNYKRQKRREKNGRKKMCYSYCRYVKVI